MPGYETSPIFLDPELADFFTLNLDGNSVHLPGNSNEILPPDTVPGLFAVALCSRAVLHLPEFKGILCAKEAKVKFLAPMLKGKSLIVKGSYSDSPHRSLKNILFRRCLNEAFLADTKEKVLEYEIIQLVRG